MPGPLSLARATILAFTLHLAGVSASGDTWTSFYPPNNGPTNGQGWSAGVATSGSEPAEQCGVNRAAWDGAIQELQGRGPADCGFDTVPVGFVAQNAYCSVQVNHPASSDSDGLIVATCLKLDYQEMKTMSPATKPQCSPDPNVAQSSPSVVGALSYLRDGLPSLASGGRAWIGLDDWFVVVSSGKPGCVGHFTSQDPQDVINFS